MSVVTGPGHEDETQEKNHSQYAFGSGRPLLHSVTYQSPFHPEACWRYPADQGRYLEAHGNHPEAHGNCLKAHGNRSGAPWVYVQSFVLVLAYIRPFICLIHYCFPFRQYGGAWKSWKYYTMKFSKRRVGGNRCLHGPLVICPLRLPVFVRLTEAAGLWMIPLIYLAAGRAYLTRDSEPKPGEDFIQLMYILKFAYIYW